MARIDLSQLQTPEARNPRSAKIDEVSTLEACEIIHREDEAVAGAVTKFIPVISAAVDALAPRVRRGGRVIYVGAGTSGRLGVLDASEIPPTFSAPFEQFVGIMAGGDAAIRRAQEGAEDSAAAGRADLEQLKLDPELDSLIGIAASGRTPYVLGCLEYAKRLGCVTIAVVCCSPSAIGESDNVDFLIAPVTGPEVVTGSTRMKAGTATKMVLNMLSTAVMIRVGKTFGNLRSRNIIRDLSGDKAPATDVEIDSLLRDCGNSVKLALGVLHLVVSPHEAQRRLDMAGGVLSKAIQQSPRSSPSQLMDSSSLVLCVDGGATKCAAVIVDSHGSRGEGLAGPCNVYVPIQGAQPPVNDHSTGMDIDIVVATIRLAATRALQDLAEKTGTSAPPLKSIDFASTWVGVAGYERAQLQLRLHSALSQLFQQPLGPRLHISNDIDLLSSVLSHDCGSSYGIALVAGTGSIALRYIVRDGRTIRTGRAGGWGHLVGDDGSGYALGRAAIRHTLAALDAHKDQRTVDPSHLSELPRRVLGYLHLSGTVSNGDVISAVMAPSDTSEHRVLDQRTRIAGVSRAVMEAAALGDAAARKVLADGVEGLLGTMQPLLTEDVEIARTSLILGGGLLGNELYRGLFLDRVRKKGYHFASVESVNQPANAGAEHLRAQIDAGVQRLQRTRASKL